jgi:hypothetical protein
MSVAAVPSRSVPVAAATARTSGGPVAIGSGSTMVTNSGANVPVTIGAGGNLRAGDSGQRRPGCGRQHHAAGSGGSLGTGGRSCSKRIAIHNLPVVRFDVKEDLGLVRVLGLNCLGLWAAHIGLCAD